MDFLCAGMKGFKQYVTAEGQALGRYHMLSLAHAGGRYLPRLNVVGRFPKPDLFYKLQLTNNTVRWTNGHPPVSNPKCGFDGSKCPDLHGELWNMDTFKYEITAVF